MIARVVAVGSNLVEAFYGASPSVTAALLFIGLATGRIYARTGGRGVVDLTDVGLVGDATIIALTACHAWRYRAVVGFVATVVSSAACTAVVCAISGMAIGVACVAARLYLGGGEWTWEWSRSI